MKREDIEQLLTTAGVTDTKDIIDKIMSMNGADISRFREENANLVAKYAKYDEYKAAVEGKQAEIDKAVEAAKAAAKTEYEKKLESERTADKRKRAKEKHYTGLTDEQKGVFDAFIKDDDLKLADDGESFSNFEELSKSVKEKYKTLFPADPNGSNKKAGLGGDDGGTGGKGGDEFADLRKIR